MKKLLLIIFLLLGVGISNGYLAQTGGKKREHKAHRRGGSLFKRNKSAGHADDFAKGSGRKGFFARIFKKHDSQGWTNRPTPGNNRRTNRGLFAWNRSKGRQYNAQVQERQNTQRSKRRIRGNKVFHKKKY